MKQYGARLLFYPHASMQQYIEQFSSDDDCVTISDRANYDVQQLLMESAMLVTDYSSVFFDFAYMQKPMIYYQFDQEKYRLWQYQEGYFSYEQDGFGVIARTETDLLLQIESLLKTGFVMPSLYAVRANGFFAFRDTDNCERTYDAIMTRLK